MITWSTKKLGEVTQLITRGISPRYISTGGVVVLNQKCIRNHVISYDEAKRHDSAKKFAAEKFIQAGDVLVNSTGVGTLGRVAQVKLINEPTVVDSHITIVRPIKGLFDLHYFGLMMIFVENLIEKMGAGSSGQIELSRTTLKAIEVIYPESIVEQKKVVKKIEELFAKIEEAQKLREVSKKETSNLFQSVLFEVFGVEKEQERMKNLTYLVNGRGFKTSEWGSAKSTSLPIIRIQNLNSKNKGFNFYSGEYDDKILVHPGDLLFSWSGSRGTSFGPHIWNGPIGLLNQHIFKVLYHKEKIDKDYFYFAMKYLVAEVERNLHGGVGLVHITKTKFENLSINVPTITEQKKIVARLNLLSSKIRELQKLQSETQKDLKDLKQAILKKAFAGE